MPIVQVMQEFNCLRNGFREIIILNRYNAINDLASLRLLEKDDFKRISYEKLNYSFCNIPVLWIILSKTHVIVI